VALSLYLRRNWRAPWNWPPPPRGFSPPAGWQPDPYWPAPPPDWRFWRLPRGRIAVAVLLLVVSGLFWWNLSWRVGVYHQHRTLDRVGVTTSAQVLEVAHDPEGDDVTRPTLTVRFTTTTGRVVTVDIDAPGPVTAPEVTSDVTYEPAHPTNARAGAYSRGFPDPDADPGTVRVATIVAAIVTLLAGLLSALLLLTRRRPAMAAIQR
jgi:hypothetical protein